MVILGGFLLFVVTIIFAFIVFTCMPCSFDNRRGEIGRPNVTLNNKKGFLLTNKMEVAKLCKQYIEELYNKEGRPEEIPLKPEEDSEDKGSELLTEELIETIKELKKQQGCPS